MLIKKSIRNMAFLCLTFLPSALLAQNDPKIIVVAKVHFNPSANFSFDEWKALEKEYFEKVTMKNDLIIGSNVLVHYYTPDNSELLLVSTYHSWEDIEKANDKNNELAVAAWPDSVKRKAFFDKQSSYFTTLHSDEIRTILPNTKMAAADTSPLIYYIRTTHRAFPADGKQGELAELLKEFSQHVTQKNTLLKGYYPSRHFWGADSREFIEAFVYKSLADMEKSAEMNQSLMKAHWPDEAKRKAFADKMGKYFEPWHGDAIYTNVPSLRKIAK